MFRVAELKAKSGALSKKLSKSWRAAYSCSSRNYLALSLSLVAVFSKLGVAHAFSGTTQLACGRLLLYLESGFGALVAAAAGVAAIVASAVGGFKAAWCLLVVAVGSFILRAFLPLFTVGC